MIDALYSFFFFFSGKQSIRVPCSFTWENSQKPENKAKNRFNNIIPCKWWYAVKYEKSGVTMVVASKDKIRSTCHAYTLKEQVYQFYSTNQVSCCKECAWVHFGSIIIVYFGFTEVGFFSWYGYLQNSSVWRIFLTSIVEWKHEAMVRREKPNRWKKGMTKMIKFSKKNWNSVVNNHTTFLVMVHSAIDIL